MLSLEFLDEYIDDSQGLSVQWPVGLEVLFLQKYNQPIDNIVWPSTLKHLYFGDFWNESTVGVEFPDSLEKLELGCNFTDRHPCWRLVAEFLEETSSWVFQFESGWRRVARFACC